MAVNDAACFVCVWGDAPDWAKALVFGVLVAGMIVLVAWVAGGALIGLGAVAVPTTALGWVQLAGVSLGIGWTTTEALLTVTGPARDTFNNYAEEQAAQRDQAQAEAAYDQATWGESSASQDARLDAMRQSAQQYANETTMADESSARQADAEAEVEAAWQETAEERAARLADVQVHPARDREEQWGHDDC